jgi:hypothetical protein
LLEPNQYSFPPVLGFEIPAAANIWDSAWGGVASNDQSPDDGMPHLALVVAVPPGLAQQERTTEVASANSERITPESSRDAELSLE